jgi:nucleotide-binding universal stress UspA family protein
MLEHKAEAQAAAWVGRLREIALARGVKLTGKVRPGEEPFWEFVEEARECGADLIILRWRGKRGFLANLLIGQMVHTVTGHAPRTCRSFRAPLNDGHAPFGSA